MTIDISPAWYRRTDSVRLRLEGSNCPNCKVLHIPARPICPEIEKGCGLHIETRGKLLIESTQIESDVSTP